MTSIAQNSQVKCMIDCFNRGNLAWIEKTQTKKTECEASFFLSNILEFFLF